jgi:eukaryotic-like serine/threonine-protein kinase
VEDFLSPLGPGDRVGRYTLVRRLAEGGMGVVFEALSDHGRRVALKVLSDWLVSEIGRQRFEREVLAAAQLQHPNIVAIYDFGETEGGTLYYAMEYLDGVDLMRLVDLDGKQEPPRAVRIVLSIAAALGHAHDAGLVHRDIKPPNILITEAGGMPDVAKLVDFGLVVPIAPKSRLTIDGHVIGTPRYAAPELLLSNGSASASTDLYALGLVAFFLLTGKHAFDAESSAEILKKQRDEPAPSLLTYGIAPDLASVIAWCLEKEPARRPGDARTLAEALTRCVDASRYDEEAARAWWAHWRANEGELALPSGSPARTEQEADRSAD